MDHESIDTIAQELHALFCGPGRWEHAMPASQDLYRSAVRVVLESSHLTNLATGAELLRSKLIEVTELYQGAKRIIDAIADALHPHWGCKPVERLKPRVIPEPDEPRIIRCSGGNCCTGIGAAYCECLCHVVGQLRADVTTVAEVAFDQATTLSVKDRADLKAIIQRGEKARET